MLMSPEQAIEVLSNATQPQAAGRIDRNGYVAIEQALAVLSEFVKSKSEPTPEGEGK